MPKKLTISELKVQSFETSLNNEEKDLVKGGATYWPTRCNKCTELCETWEAPFCR